MSSPVALLSQFKDAVKAKGFEDQFLKVTGLASLDELSIDNFKAMYGQADSLTKQIGVPVSFPEPAKEKDKSEADAPPAKPVEEASDYLYAYKDCMISYVPRTKVTYFIPNAVMMYLYLHQINSLLVDHFYFLRSAPDYHPLLFRLYFGVLFIHQIHRSMHASNVLTNRKQYEFFKQFNEAFPPETLPIPAPLLHIFKSLCASKPEVPQYGLLVPYLPPKAHSGPLKAGGRYADWSSFMIPDITGILSYLQLQSSQKVYAKGFTPSFVDPSDDTKKVDLSFGGATYSKDPSKWTDGQAFSLLSPGIEHPVESGEELNKKFFTGGRYKYLDLPEIDEDVTHSSWDSFCYLEDDYQWFSSVRDMVNVASKFFPGSGSLADCTPVGIRAAQAVIKLQAPKTLPKKPTEFQSKAKYGLDVSYKIKTTQRNISNLEIVMASASHVCVEYYSTHPFLKDQGSLHTIAAKQTGEFWDIRPIEESEVYAKRLYSVADTIKRGIREKA